MILLSFLPLVLYSVLMFGRTEDCRKTPQRGYYEVCSKCRIIRSRHYCQRGEHVSWREFTSRILERNFRHRSRSPYDHVRHRLLSVEAVDEPAPRLQGASFLVSEGVTLVHADDPGKAAGSVVQQLLNHR